MSHADEMTPQAMKQRLAAEALEVEAYLGGCLKGRGIPCDLLKAMDYSLLAGGKRLRPVLCLTTAGLFGLARDAVLPFAAAIELIHTYSLVHDDLPAMDDDDLRRGMPSNHKKFGEATAILAGDGLLTEAFCLMASAGAAVEASRVLSALSVVAAAAGAGGMVGGQMLDMEYTGRADVSLDMLRGMHAMKTGALIRCSCLAGALLAGAPHEDAERISHYGEAIGAAFQIVDDILDETGDEATLGKPVGSDSGQGKNTYPSLLGLERSRELAQQQVDAAVACLSGYEGENALFLRALAQYIADRAM
ncbi:Polyprenyl synthetase [Oleidesulfovibrio alaskensis G20]|uniref:Polyprenyl synthetase n=1 Tax=Oleidesulfovibrio alaskensis (strain ATCC BAA-1058 / DSM 17464 / G20) TaxID=207559 RepID=Q30Z98_OLEA2|nr:farnesyl diphosphate synthase [Oleidesulfovibrio alaskensis]ABB38998.1 Polyprenyl synthetase [Oleidesulfovibrio alaskensis G20]